MKLSYCSPWVSTSTFCFRASIDPSTDRSFKDEDVIVKPREQEKRLYYVEKGTVGGTFAYIILRGMN